MTATDLAAAVRERAAASRAASVGASAGEWAHMMATMRGRRVSRGERHSVYAMPHGRVVAKDVDSPDAEHIRHHSPQQTAQTAELLEALAGVLSLVPPPEQDNHKHWCPNAFDANDPCTCGMVQRNERRDALLARVAKAVKP